MSFCDRNFLLLVALLVTIPSFSQSRSEPRPHKDEGYLLVEIEDDDEPKETLPPPPPPTEEPVPKPVTPITPYTMPTFKPIYSKPKAKAPVEPANWEQLLKMITGMQGKEEETIKKLLENVDPSQDDNDTLETLPSEPSQDDNLSYDDDDETDQSGAVAEDHIRGRGPRRLRKKWQKPTPKLGPKPRRKPGAKPGANPKNLPGFYDYY